MMTMKKYSWILIALSIGFFSCKTSKVVAREEVVQAPPPPPTPPKDAGENAVNEPITYRFTLSFFSIGEGIDSESHEKWVEFLDKHSPALLYDKTGWGREGELDYCLMLKELPLKGQEEFILQTRKLLEKCTRVHLEEYKPCKHKK